VVSIVLLVTSLCLMGGEQIDLSPHVAPTVSAIELKATMNTNKGSLLIYSPGREDRQITLTSAKSIGRLSISQPILCVKATGGPFDFNIEAKPIASLTVAGH
jgi:hypothetical protein